MTLFFCQTDSITLDVRNQACQEYPNNKFEISLQYLKENGKDGDDFLLVDKHQIFLQIDTIILGVYG